MTHIGLHINTERKGRAERQRGREAAAGVVLHSQPCCYARSNISLICSENLGTNDRKRAEDLLQKINTDNVNLISLCTCVCVHANIAGQVKTGQHKIHADHRE